MATAPSSLGALAWQSATSAFSIEAAVAAAADRPSSNASSSAASSEASSGGKVRDGGE